MEKVEAQKIEIQGQNTADPDGAKLPDSAQDNKLKTQDTFQKKEQRNLLDMFKEQNSEQDKDSQKLKELDDV